MPHRRSFRILVAAFLLAGLAPLSPAGELISIVGPLPPGGTARLAKSVAFYGDYGTIAVAEGDVAAVTELVGLGYDARAHGAWPEHADVLVALLDHVPESARVERRTAVQALIVVPRDAEPSVAHRCAHEAQPVTRSAFVPSRGFVDPRGNAPGALAAITPDARISALVAQVSTANLQATVNQLASYGTRRADSQGIQNAKTWLIQQLQAIPGLTVTTAQFNASYAPNIVVTKTGLVHPERIVVLGAHYDSINLSGAAASAPGADDNASGSAGILESARLLAQVDFEATIRLVLFSAEELGLLGSAADAVGLNTAGADVIGMLNMDMIAHRNSGDAVDLDFATNNTDAALTQFCRDVTAAYVPTLPTVTGVLTAGTSDHQSYQSNGIPAAFLFEDLTGYSTVIHTANDTVSGSANDFTLATKITQAFIASAATMAGPVDLVLAHSGLPNTTDAGGPYPLSVQVTSLTSAAAATCSVTWRVDGGPWQTANMFASGTPGQFVGSLPGVAQGKVEYWLLATDDLGRSQWQPDAISPGGATFAFFVGAASPLFTDGFEAAGENGWTSGQVAVQNDWQKGTPQGKGGFDPASAGAGTSARGNDLGIGNFNGNYASNASNWLESPAIDATGATGLRLRFLRQLSVEDGLYDQAAIRVNGALVWQNPATQGGTSNLIDTAWTAQDIDVSALADGQPAVKIRFELKADGGLEFGGWTIDDVALMSVQPGLRAPLVASARYVSASLGSSTPFDIDLGPAFAGRTVVLALSATPGSPGTVLSGVPLPIQFDAVTNLGFTLLNSPAFANFAQTLSGIGTSVAPPTLNLPPLALPALTGFSLHLCAFTLAPTDVATNAVTLTFVP